jgi:hypothetical protein
MRDKLLLGVLDTCNSSRILFEIFFQLLQAWRFQFPRLLTTIVGSLLKRISPPRPCAAAWLCAAPVLPMVTTLPLRFYRRYGQLP